MKKKFDTPSPSITALLNEQYLLVVVAGSQYLPVAQYLLA
jgi:hypothetical protein